ncbi:EGF domain-specific O-linked N-acetylglucosamine transferase [Gryllus bimaculatus]|nr:EGF domain-specific O-linked N-acetylglucosamine transferase [Gryllus bimaculatus]
MTRVEMNEWCIRRIFTYQILFGLLVIITQNYAFNFSEINLPKEHLPFYFSNYPAVAEKCKEDEKCPYKDELDKNVCWGYEHGCRAQNSYSRPSCPGDHKGWVKTKQDQLNTFYSQGDFGYIKDQLQEMMVICEPTFVDDSSLECSKHLRFCRGRNIMINFTDLSSCSEPIRYKMDVLKEGQIGGYCQLHKSRLDEECDHISPLQSWGPELRYFTQLSRRPIVEKDCDVVIEKPTFVLKIDATVNMYHHFCDFLNLYASLHMNSTHPSTFSSDVHILIWESYTYQSSFEVVWEAFTNHPVWDLKTFRGDTVCFKNIVFPLLPRMIFGLFYNTPIVTQSTNLTWFVLLIQVIYNRQLQFKQQLEITYNTDIFIGIHGAGLTHLLFLPDWAVVFELYNCEDEGCYMDLARLRGVKYITWQDKSKLEQQDQGHHPDGGAHAKFTNYSFDVNEFLRLVAVAAKHVKNHKAFQAFHKDIHDEL